MDNSRFLFRGKCLEVDIHLAVTAEYDRAAEKFGAKHNSAHEAYAVILEEYEEAMKESKFFVGQLREIYWRKVKGEIRWEPPEGGCLEEMYDAAKSAACEWVQVAAMCHKALQGYEREDKQNAEN